MAIELSTPKSISDIYFLSNTPSFLYNMMKQDSYVHLISNYDAKELFDEFYKRANAPIATLEEMSLMYAILVALTLKPLVDVKEYLDDIQKNIGFEWFADIVQLFYNNKINDPIIQSFNLPSVSYNSTFQI